MATGARVTVVTVATAVSSRLVTIRQMMADATLRPPAAGQPHAVDMPARGHQPPGRDPAGATS
jgi:hypothetical protein